MKDQSKVFEMEDKQRRLTICNIGFPESKLKIMDQN